MLLAGNVLINGRTEGERIPYQTNNKKKTFNTKHHVGV